MTNKKRISKLLKKKYKPVVNGRKIKCFNNFQFGIDIGSSISEMTNAFKKLAEVTAIINLKPRQFTRPYESEWKQIFEKNLKINRFDNFRNEILNYPVSEELSLPELKKRVEDLTNIVRTTPIGTERWQREVLLLKKARRDFDSMREKKYNELGGNLKLFNESCIRETKKPIPEKPIIKFW